MVGLGLLGVGSRQREGGQGLDRAEERPQLKQARAVHGASGVPPSEAEEDRATWGPRPSGRCGTLRKGRKDIFN